MPKRKAIPELAEFRRLKREHPELEDDELWKLAGWEPSGVMPTWATNGSSPKPAFYRRDPREAREEKK